METGTYQIAGLSVRVSSLYTTVHGLCRDYATEEEPDLCVTITLEDIRQEQKKSTLQDTWEGRTPRTSPEEYLETLAVYRKIAERMVEYDTLLIHGSAIALDGEAYLFIAKSGTGKSTHTRLWRETFGSRAVMVNDDKPLVRVKEASVQVCGTPWDGKHHLSSNIQAPLKAICILERGTENRIREITPSEALPELLQQSYRPEDPQNRLKALAILDAMTKQLRFYRLQCNMESEASIVAYEAFQPEV